MPISYIAPQSRPNCQLPSMASGIRNARKKVAMLRATSADDLWQTLESKLAERAAEEERMAKHAQKSQGWLHNLVTGIRKAGR